MSDRTVIARDLVKTYENGRTRALNGVSLEGLLWGVRGDLWAVGFGQEHSLESHWRSR
jgi:hypothetical protein